MARLLDAPLPGRIASHDARLTVDFRQLGAAATSIARTAAEEELLPAYTKDDVEIEVVPFLSALAALNQLELRGHIVDSRLQFEGGLSAIPEASDSE
jgi:hypothetical protein